MTRPASGAPPYRAYPRARYPLPVYRGMHFRLECRCGKILNVCQHPGPCRPHLEIWADGCTFTARFYPTPAPRPTITAKTPAQEVFIARRRAADAVPTPTKALTPKPTKPPKPPPPPRVTLPPAVIARWQAGESPAALAREVGLPRGTFWRLLKTQDATRERVGGRLLRHQAAITAAYQAGTQCSTLAREYGTSPALLRLYLQRWGLLE